MAPIGSDEQLERRGLSPEELEAEKAAELPDRRAMSLICPRPVCVLDLLAHQPDPPADGLEP
jgi:hypothetical protein